MSSNRINPGLSLHARRLIGALAALLALLTPVCSVAAGIPWPPPGKPGDVAADLTARNFYVVFDGSGSMSERACQGDGRKIEQAKAALAAFAKAAPRNANIGLLVFDDKGISERVPLGLDNREEFMRQIAAVRPSGGTPLSSAISQARQRLEVQARRQHGYGEYNLVVVTDGEANTGQDPRAAVNDMLARSPIVLHTIGFCISTSHSLNQKGRTVYRAANDRADIERGLETVLAESPKFIADKFNAPR
jgi:Ca-activated chloride channel family protein